jgi:uncharacterized membrane protein YccF (DUF307 family)
MSKNKNGSVNPLNSVIEVDTGPGCLVQILWFAFVGWWAGQLWIAIAYLALITIVGIPIAVVMFNKLPQILALRSPKKKVITSFDDASWISFEQKEQQFPLIVRAIYFVLIGWWLTGLWVELGFILCATIIGMPIGFRMFDAIPMILSLHRD